MERWLLGCKVSIVVIIRRALEYLTCNVGLFSNDFRPSSLYLYHQSYDRGDARPESDKLLNPSP